MIKMENIAKKLLFWHKKSLQTIMEKCTWNTKARMHYIAADSMKIALSKNMAP